MHGHTTKDVIQSYTFFQIRLTLGESLPLTAVPMVTSVWFVSNAVRDQVRRKP